MFFLLENNRVIFQQQVILPAMLLRQSQRLQVRQAAAPLTVFIFTGGKAGDLLGWNMQQCQFFTDLL